MDQTALDLPVGAENIGQTAGRSSCQPVGRSTSASFFSPLLLPTRIWLKTRSIFACQAPGYSADRYLAYCGGGNYADFEHGAFFTTSNLQRWTTPATPMCWFSATAACRWPCPTTRRPIGSSARRLELLPAGIQLQRGHGFHRGPFASKINPRASVYIINVDDFFERRETAAAKTILHDPDARSRYEWKHFCAVAAPADLRRLSRAFAGRSLSFSARAKREPITGSRTRSRSSRRTRSAMTGRSIRPWSKTARRCAIEFPQGIRQGEMCHPDRRSLSGNEDWERAGDRGGRWLAAGRAQDGRAQHDGRLSPRPA